MSSHDPDPTWEILDALFNQSGGIDCTNTLVRHQIESMNEFLDKKLIQIIQGFNSIQVYHNYSQELHDFKYKINLNILQPALTKPMYQETDGSQLLMTPHLARMNNLTYSGNLYVDVHVITEIVNDDGVTERKESSIPGVCIGKIPIMIRSKACVLSQMPSLADGKTAGDGGNECRYDFGGYFIVNGSEKVIISQDRIIENDTLIFAPNGNGDGLSAEIRSMPDGMFLPPKTTNLHMSGKPNHMGNVIKLSASFMRSEVPLFVMFRALGIESDKEIYAHIVHDLTSQKHQRIISQLAACAEDASDIHTQADALHSLLKVLGTTGTPKEYLEQPEKALAIIKNTIKNDFLSHVGYSFKKKALYLGFMVKKLLSIHLKYENYDNRDSYLHKRIDTPGILFSNLFRQCYGKMIKEVRNLVVRELNLWRANSNVPLQLITQNNVHRFFKQTIIETGLRYALSTGNWGIKSIGSFQNIRQGVAQMYNRMSYLSSLSHLRRINTPMEKNGKLVQPRKLENSQFGMICPNETPEGAAVGLVKNLALSTHITVNISSVYVREVIEQLGTCMYSDEIENTLEYLAEMGNEESVMIHINGDIVGYHRDPVFLYSKLKHLKRYGSIPPTTAIVWNVQRNIISISTEAGRMCRPLYIVDSKTNRLKLNDILKEKKVAWKEFSKDKTFQHFVAPMEDDFTEGFIEYMDVEEIDKAMVAMTQNDLSRGIKGTSLPPHFTNCEIHPSLLNGVLAANIPFMDHNQSPRNCYQCLWLEEPVLMANGMAKHIKDIKIGEEVLCFNPETMVITNTTVIHQYVRPAMKPIYRISSISGRSIVATQDHKFITNKGWKDTFGFNKNIKMGIHPGPELIFQEDIIENEILSRSSMHYVSPGIVERLISYNLLPFMNTHKNIGVIARIAGYINAARPLGFNSFIDQMKFDNDVGLLGFIEHGHRDSCFVHLMIALGAYESIVPTWVTNGSILVRREYIAGFCSKNSSDAIPLDIKKLMDTVGLSNTPANYMSNFGYAYNNIKNTSEGRDAEYDKYCDIYKDAGELMTLEEWRNLVEIKGHLIFVPFEKTIQMRHVTISDITVASDNHSFIGGRGFAVSNSAMGKQAVGVYMSNYNHRIDTMAHVLHYPQKALVSTRLSRYVFSDELPCGINAVVAIMTHTGFNQEDSVMMNQSAIDRGLFTSTYFKSYRDQCSKNHSTGEEEIFTKPIVDTSSRVKPFNYDKLGEDGFVPKNTYITPTDIIIGKQMPFKLQGVSGARDTSMQVKGNDEGNIDGNYTGVNGEGYKFCKVRLRKYRKIVIGDKAACYSRDHEVMTTSGWVSIADLTKEHKVATIVNNALVYQQPTELQVYDYKGKMYSVQTNEVNLLVTPKHRMYVSSYGDYKIQEAKKIYHMRIKYKKNIDEWKPDYNSPNVPMCLIIDDDCVTYYRFIRSEEAPELLIDINIWISLYGIYHGKTSQLMDKCAREAIDDDEWHLLCAFASALLAHKERLDEWTYWLNIKQTKKLISTLCIKGHDSWQYRTKFNDLADDFQRLCVHAGYSSNKKFEDEYWVLTINKNNEPIVQDCVDKWVKFDDKVYCCTVPLGDGVIYVRRNGIPVWSGQSRSAQKGCLGMVYGQHEMPFSKNGITPDIIMNPHAIPSRMTMGQLMECIMGKAACHIGACGDATPFNGCSVEDIADVLAKSGYERYGNEILYDGRTGRQINTEIFIGPTYYQRLKHMVSDKCHSRGSNGPIIMLTRQPAEGRARNGGLRFGEMERDCIIGHGASAFLKERMLDVSDNFRVFICRKCGLIPIANPEKAIYKCNFCKNNADISQVRIPYSMKLLIQELMTMSVAPRIVV